ncbi:hypothetical protein [Legionella worsleiensis]|uniref:Uncharacterized protein n=1 Tax=Legionella worsleiensis TaxID=45076 RepID=A0A0W1AFG2_9GAMM|nr:hypothetical protein [Legionella worsleiensis]KTD80063.1 hypothetical protein Lwor_1577 [Legionella worsleiensis]STY32536.1 Uncharacterised protein [Legionella worsleiensis]
MTNRNKYRVALFGFDHTLCRKPTFYYFKNRVVDCDERRKHEPILHFNFNQSDYECGKRDAPALLKTNVAAWFLHDDHYTSAIVTFHSYPDYIAGYLAYILGRELKRVDTNLTIPEEKNLIAVYQVEGESRPILISYINPTLKDRSLITLSHDWKTGQLTQLRAFMLSNSWIEEEEPLHFYEGVCSHIECGDADCGVPSTLGYIPRNSQLALQRSTPARAITNRTITVHRVYSGEQFEAALIAEEMGVIHDSSISAKTDEPFSPPKCTSPKSESYSSVLLMSLGFFVTAAAAFGAGFGAGILLQDNKDQMRP